MDYTLITGATSDIGIQICKTLEDSGQKLLITDVSSESLYSLKSSLTHFDEHLILPLDLSNNEECKQNLADFISIKKINISKAVFAAGIFAVKPLKIIDYEFMKKSFDIALFSFFSLMQVLSSKKINSDRLKSVVVISSVNSKIGSKGYSVYASVKSAMLGAVKSLAVELAPKVRVNAILPGAIRTKTTNFLFEAQGDGSNPRYLLGEGKCDDVSNMVAFLLSDKSRWITGQELVVDGGLTIN